jgi:hypothetical protein
MTPATTDCRQCRVIAREWGEETRVTCSECGAVMTKAPVDARKWTVGDLQLLARWQRKFYGSGLMLREPVQTSGGDTNGPEDERTSEFHRAAAVRRRFEGMRTGAGRLHYAVLWFVIFDRDNRASDASVAASKKSTRENKLMEEVGKAFSPHAQQRAWASHKETALQTRLPRVFGQRLYDAAVRAWEVGDENQDV